MAFDGIITRHIVLELRDQLIGGRIRKIFQPENDELRLIVNVGKENYNLLLSANANNPRAYLTQEPKSNPGTPPAFCMVLRKYILNGIILDIVQYLSDRLIEIQIGCKNDFGDSVTRCLILEIMGRNANLILTDSPATTGGPAVIMDSLKKVGSSSSRYRQILPGRNYIFPPENDRVNCFTLTPDQLIPFLKNNSRLPLEKTFVQKMLGISPAVAREICYRAGVGGEATPLELTTKQLGWLRDSFAEIQHEIVTGPMPAHYGFHRDIVEFSTLGLHHLTDTEVTRFDSVSEMLEDYYYQKDKKIRFNAKAAGLKQKLSTLYKKSAKKLQNLKRDMQKSRADEESKLYGDLITANIWQLERGMTEAELVNYMDPEMRTITVPLKVNETPAQNAQRYYKKYNKAKRAQVILEEQIALCEEQTYYLDSLLNALEQCTEPEELDEIRHEVNQSEFANKSDKKNKKPMPSKPLHYRSSEGFDIYVGKNNYQNDYISTRLGTDEDCWLHVKDIPGSHVLIVADGKFITEATVLEGGMLAAWHSKARGSQNVPVDYVEFKHVHKPNKAKPGMVIFTGQNTMYVTPKRDAVMGMEIVEN